MAARHGILPIVLALILAGCASLAMEPTAAPAPTLPTAPGLHEIVLTVNGTEATGVFAVPDAASSSLVVFGHWYGGDPEGTRAVVKDLVERGTYVVAMDYRGEVGDWNVEAGAQDTLAAAELVLLEHPALTEVVAQGFSMGGEVTGMVVARAPPGTFDHWVSGAGVMDLVDEWTKVPIFRDAIEAETGGTPTSAPDAYAARSPVALARAIAAQGLTRAYLVHATGDPIVPFGQAQAMADALAAAGVPVTLYEARVAGGIDACRPECEAIPIGVAGHEVGLWPPMTIVQHRVDRLDERTDPAIHGTYDGRTDTYDPSDVP